MKYQQSVSLAEDTLSKACLSPHSVLASAPVQDQAEALSVILLKHKGTFSPT